MHDAFAHPLLPSLNLLFSDVFVAIAVLCTAGVSDAKVQIYMHLHIFSNATCTYSIL